MFLRPEDAAKLGQLYLQKGKWNGVQVIPESWVETSTTKHIDNGEGNFGYGYQVWMSDRPGSFAYNGMLGQDVIVYPDTDMVIVINAGNKEMTQEGNLTDIIRGYFGAGYEPSEEALPEDTAGALELRSTVRRLEGKEVHLPCIVRGGWGERRSAYRPEVGEADLISMQGTTSVFVFNSFGGIDSKSPNYIGEYNIFELPNWKDFDGVIIEGNLLMSDEIRQKVWKDVRASGVPAVVADYPLEGCPFIGVNNYKAMCEIVEHLITQHNCHIIHFISGPDWHLENQERLRAYRDTLKKFSLPLDDSMTLR